MTKKAKKNVLLCECFVILLCMYILITRYGLYHFYDAEGIEKSAIENVPLSEVEDEIKKLDRAEMIVYSYTYKIRNRLYIFALYDDRTLVTFSGYRDELIGDDNNISFSKVYDVKKQRISMSRYSYLINVGSELYRETIPYDACSGMDTRQGVMDIRYKGERYVYYPKGGTDPVKGSIAKLEKDFFNNSPFEIDVFRGIGGVSS